MLAFVPLGKIGLEEPKPGNLDNHQDKASVIMYMNLGSCLKCKGGLVHEGDEWRCLQCGKYYYLQSLQALEQVAVRKTWGINASIQATQSSEARWRPSKHEIIDHLTADRTTREISNLTRHSPRRVQSVRERLSQPQ